MTHSSSDNNAHRQTVGEWLARPFEWRIPVYQRHYAWDSTKESGPIYLFYETVREQTADRLNGQSRHPHYLGVVLVDDKTDRSVPDGITRYDVVDGQQRLTTIQVALLALIRVADEHNCGNEIKTELEKYVFSNKERNLPRLLPTNFDNKQFKKVLYDAYDVLADVGGRNVSRENAEKSKVVATFDFFKEKFDALAEEHARHEPQNVVRAIKDTLTHGFDLVLIVLRESDDAQRIFESMNNYAKPLTTFDLIRNNVFHRAASVQPGRDVELFYTDNWQQLEKPYWEEKADNRRTGGATHIEAYVARLLVAKMQKDLRFNLNEIFGTYKEFHKDFSSIDDEIGALVRYTDVYRYLDSSASRNPVAPDFDFGVFQYGIWKNRDFYPVIFSIVGSDADTEQKQRMLKLLESYVIRRAVCALSSAYYNKHAVSICAALGDNPDYEKLDRFLKAAAKDTTVFPNNNRVIEGCVNERFYGSVFQRYVFEKIEKSMHDVRVERVVVEEGALTIDHILPRGWDKNEQWKNIVLGADASRRETEALAVNSYLDTIGNLTLMSGKNNSVKSNRPLADVKGLLSESTVKLNRELSDKEEWNVAKIVARSKGIAGKICEIWPYDIA